MPLTYVQGDPLLTSASHLALAHNAKGRLEPDAFATAALRRHPVAFSTYRRKSRQGQHSAGDIFLWMEASPALLFLVVRPSSVSSIRLRTVQQCLLTLIRDYHLYGISSLALAPFGTPAEQAEIHLLYDQWLATSPLQVAIYDGYVPGMVAQESFT